MLSELRASSVAEIACPADALPARSQASRGANGFPNDPLAGRTAKRIWHDCVWLSDEDTNVKILLLCVGRFMKPDLRSSTMSYAQIATACGFSNSTAKRAAKAAGDRWLRIEVGKGRYVPGKGRENLYHGIIPARWLAELRHRKLHGHTVSADHEIVTAADAIVAHLMRSAHQFGVSDSHPEVERGVTLTPPGCHTDTLTHYYPLEEIGGTAPTVGVSSRHPEENGKPKIEAVLDPEKAYAERNITVLPSGKLTIGDDFRAELLQALHAPHRSMAPSTALLRRCARRPRSSARCSSRCAASARSSATTIGRKRRPGSGRAGAASAAKPEPFRTFRR